MNLREYQRVSPDTWINAPSIEIDRNHATHGLLAEAGEIAGCYQKFYRGDYDDIELRHRLEKEIGGLMYYLAMVANFEYLDLEVILEVNRNQLLSRKKRGKIQGDGDER